MVHEAVLDTADLPLGHVVSGDFLYDQIAANLMSTAQLPKEVFENVQRFGAGDANSQLKGKLLKLIFLINKLPAEAALDIGLRATEDALADLLVTDLSAGSSELRKKLPGLLAELQNKDNLVMALTGGSGTEYRLQTRESSAWYDEFRAQEAELKAAPQRVEQKRADLLKSRFGDLLKKVRVQQGKDNIERRLTPVYDDALPRDHDRSLYLWVQDGWQTEEKSVVAEAKAKSSDKSHLFQQVSPYAHLISGGKATVARMFVNNASGQRGLVCQYDVVCFDEVSGVSFDQKDGVNIMKGYMESGEFSRGKESIRADGSIVLVGNFDVDVEHQQRIGHLFGPLPPEMRDDTAFMDRIHCFLPGWDVPKLNPSLFTEHFGLVSDFLSECFTQLRGQSRVSSLQAKVYWGGALSGRDINGVNKTVSGLLKLMYPDASMAVSDEDLEWAVRLALEVRRRVKEQQKRIGAAEFRNTHFSYTLGAEGIEKFVSTPELQSQGGIGDEPLECGQIWVLSPGGQDEHPGLFRLEVTEGPGSGVRVLNNPVPSAFKESIRCAEQNLYARAQQLVGDREPRAHEFSVQLRGFDAAKSGAKTGVAALVALSSALLKKSVRGGLVVAGEVTLGGTIEPIHNAVSLAEIAVEKGAKSLLLPVSCRRQLFDLSDEMATKLDIEFYQDGRDALLKALTD